MKYNAQIVCKWFREHGIYAVPEYSFCPGRKWRFDFVFSGAVSDIERDKVALEVQGGLFIGGRHSRGPALLKEHEKLNTAASLGWRILYTIPDNLCMTETVDLVRRALAI